MRGIPTRCYTLVVLSEARTKGKRFVLFRSELISCAVRQLHVSAKYIIYFIPERYFYDKTHVTFSSVLVMGLLKSIKLSAQFSLIRQILSQLFDFLAPAEIIKSGPKLIRSRHFSNTPAVD
ncbi:hypothetical protein PUN28_003159 [Cardiocondyla obscurior]|uniref:Uncharacterized protein n=1 Tax=Cardiocondyla obscurior TaxID=286306 RepID=A0AAW2GKF6_9HYME